MNPHHPPSRPSGQLPTAASRASSPAPVDDAAAGLGTGNPARGVRATWWYTFTSMAAFAMIVPFVVLIVQRNTVDPSGTAEPLLITVEVLVVLCAGSAVWGCLLMRRGLGGGWPRPRDAVVVLAPPAVVWALTLGLPGAGVTGGFPLWMAMNVVVPLLTRIAQRLVLVGGAVLYLVHWLVGQRLTGAGEGGPQLASLLFLAVMCPLIFAVSAWWWNVVVQLDAARRDAGQLAVARERLRFASDLHDIQGHHLQVIALKAELAERLLDRARRPPEDAAAETQADPALAGARENVHEIRSLARTALEETRSIVRDLRAVSFEEELANAKDVLEAAGAATSLRLNAVVEEPTARTLLGLAVREAATNILRHATASHVSVSLTRSGGAWTLVVQNDGAGPDGVRPGTGTGLAGLDRRFEASGGAVTSSLEDGRFTLRARLPVTAPARATRQDEEETA